MTRSDSFQADSMGCMNESAYPLEPLEIGRPGRLISIMSRFSVGVREVAAQIPDYTEWWDAQNRASYSTGGPLLAVIGDSSALGIGASHPSKGYVAQVQSRLSVSEDRSWGVANLAKSGAKLDDALGRQLAELKKLTTPDLVICCVGSNDIFWSLSTFALQRKLKTLIDGLPSGSYVAALAGGSPRSKASNKVLEKFLETKPHRFVNPWGMPGPSGLARLADDKFHPNDIGYGLMADAFIESMADEQRSTSRQGM